jgi:hypothetical protein
MDNPQLNKMKELADKIARYLCDCQDANTPWQYPAIIGIMKDYYITARPATPEEELTSLRELFGLDPNFTDGKSVEQFLKDQRDEDEKR